MKTEVRKRLQTCLILWAAFAAIKWVTLLSPSSVIAFLNPLMVVLRDSDKDYHISGWICLGIETALVLPMWLVGRRRLRVIYAVCMVYALLYAPVMIYWVIKLKLEPWRYFQFVPAVLCGLFMAGECLAYFRQEKLRVPHSKADNDNDTENEENENGSSDE